MYYNALVATARFDSDLEQRLERAARLAGVSKSQFIRDAVTERIDATLGATVYDRMAHLIGKVSLGGGVADRAHEAAAELVLQEHLAERETKTS